MELKLSINLKLIYQEVDRLTLVVLVVEPFDAVKSHQRNKRKQQGLMKEFLQRLEHPQISGGAEGL